MIPDRTSGQDFHFEGRSVDSMPETRDRGHVRQGGGLKRGCRGSRTAVHLPGHSPAPARTAFTLVELLVVLAVIGILAALLLPALNRGRASARSVKCTANLRQLVLAAQMYWDDNSGSCFRYGGTATNGGQLYWFGWMGSGGEGERDFDITQGALYPYLRGRGVELCPVFDYTAPQIKLKAKGAAYGYGYNLYLSTGLREPPFKTTRIRTPSITALFADAAQVNTWQPPASSAHPMLEEWYYIDNSSNQPNGHFRHSRKANVAHCDGHVGREQFVPGSVDPRMPEQLVARFRPEILLLP